MHTGISVLGSLIVEPKGIDLFKFIRKTNVKFNPLSNDQNLWAFHMLSGDWIPLS